MKQDSILKFASAGITGLSTITGGGFKKASGCGTKKGSKKSKKSKAKSYKSHKSSKSGNGGGCYSC